MERSMPMHMQTQARSAVRTLSPQPEQARDTSDAKLLLARARHVAMAQAAEGRLGEGLNLLCDALELAPASVDLLSDIAALLLAAGELQQAALQAHRAVQLAPQHGPSLYTLGFALSGLGEAKAALEVLRILQEPQARASLLQEAPDLLPLVDSELQRLQAGA